jgi:hypothetical protein
MKLPSVQLIFGANQFDRVVSGVDKLLAQHHSDIG